ncbi:MAG: two-component regulator propeller domain-containing protein [Chloroherpetonaceae bacterium]|nr:two-component regulator propeller domain-containing protein [Chloroherpetonaceae bacterium]
MPPIPENADFSSLTSADGLSNSGVNKIIQDGTGFIWIATGDGLNRYDGYRFKVFINLPNDSTSLSDSDISSLYVDQSNRFWVGTRNGLNLYLDRKEQFLRIKLPFEKVSHLPRFSQILSITSIDTNHIWVLTAHQLYKISTKTLAVSAFSLPQIPYKFWNSPLNMIDEYDGRNIAFDKAGNLWLSHGFGGLYIFEPYKESFKPVSMNKGFRWIENIHFHTDGSLWFSYSNDAFSESDFVTPFLSSKNLGSIFLGKCTNPLVASENIPITVSNIDTFKFSECYDIVSMKSNHIAVAIVNKDMSSGFYIYDSDAQKKWTYARNANSRNTLHDNFISCLFEDRSGVFWIGSFTSGVNYFAPYQNKFASYSSQYLDPLSVDNAFMRGVIKDRENFIWICTQFGSIHRISPNRKDIQRYSIPNQIGSWAILEDKKGDIWAGGVGKFYLYKFNRKANRFDKFPIVQSFHQINTIFEDSKQRLWLGSSPICYLTPDRKKYVETNFLSFELQNYHNAIQDIFETKDGTLWFGATNSGFAYHPETKVFRSLDSLLLNAFQTPNLLISQITSLTDTTLRIVTKGKGILVCTTSLKVIEVISKEQGLPHNNCYGALDDENGNWWISSDAGICSFNPRTRSFEYYTTDDGLLSMEFNRKSFFQSKDHELFFGGVNGLHSFYPSQIKKNPYSPKLVITDIRQGMNSINLNRLSDSSIQISYIDDPLTLEFSSLDFQAPVKNRFRYKFDKSKEWNEVGTNRTITFAKLNPGTHVLRVVGTNSDGIWSYANERAIRIEVIPPFYLSRWFITLVGIFIVFSSVGFYSYRVIRERKRADRLEQLVKERTQELATALREMNEQKELAEEANRFKTELLGLAAHDLRNPLQTIQGFATLIKEDVPKESNVAELSEYISKASQRMFSLISDLLETVQLDSSSLKLNFLAYNISKVIEQTVKLQRQSSEKKNQTLICNIEPNCYAIIDERRFDQIIENIISNAIKFSPNGKRIWIELKRDTRPHSFLIDASSKSNESKLQRFLNPFSSSIVLTRPEVNTKEVMIEVLVFTVRDEGLGMSETDLKRIFGRFQRLSARPTGGETSSGLGLSIVKKLVDLHNGKIFVSSPGKEKGCTFTLELPSIQTPAIG